MSDHVYRQVFDDGTTRTVGSELTSGQVDLLKRRCDEFPAFVEDSAPIIDELVRDTLGGGGSWRLADLEPFIDTLDTMLRDEVFDDADPEKRTWVACRVMYFLAELLIRRFGARWVIDTMPASRSFGQYVVDVPLEDRGLGTCRVNVRDHARAFVAMSPPRSLALGVRALLEQIESQRR